MYIKLYDLLHCTSLVMDERCFARKQEWTDAVLQQNGHFKDHFERDVSSFCKKHLHCMEAMVKY